MHPRPAKHVYTTKRGTTQLSGSVTHGVYWPCCHKVLTLEHCQLTLDSPYPLTRLHRTPNMVLLRHLTIALLPLMAVAQNGKLYPWEVSVLNTHSPSSRPGSSPAASLDLKISDPNTLIAGKTDAGDVEFPSSSANCSVQWNSVGEEPFGWITPCESTSPTAIWTVEMQGGNATGYGPSPTRDFKLKFVLEESVEVGEKIVGKTFAGVGAFALGDTLSMVCGASGACTLSLRKGTVLVQQELVAESTAELQSGL